jgi:tetracycline 7-halogenase / FADH2 O2-dependent halogenase
MLDRHQVLKSILGPISLAGVPGRTFSTSRLQRLVSMGAGEDWAALPFTVGFIDPLHSTGIAHSLHGVDRLCDILLSDDKASRGTRLQHYSTSVVDELRHIDRIVAGCYEGLCDFRLFTAWTMVYFAAATTSELRWLEFLGKSPGSELSPGFLCADDPEFVRTVEHLSLQLDEAKSAALLSHSITWGCFARNHPICIAEPPWFRTEQAIHRRQNRLLGPRIDRGMLKSTPLQLLLCTSWLFS